MEKRTEIDGKRVIHEFSVLWNGWEMDNQGWITEDGRAWMTNHGHLSEVNASSIHARAQVAMQSAQELMKALQLMTKRKQGDTGVKMTK